MQYARLAAQTSTSVRLQKNQLGAIAPRLQSACSNVAHHVKLSPGLSSAFLAHARHQSTDSRGRGTDIDRDFILSILQAQPSARDSRSYLRAFASEHNSKGKQKASALFGKPLAGTTAGSETLLTAEAVPGLATVSSTDTNPLVEEILNPITRHTAVVKVQGPFTARQRHSIAEGLIYLQRLGLVSIIVVDDEAWANAGHIGSSAAQLRKEMVQMAEALAEEFESMGGRAIPLVKSLFRLKSQSSSAELQEEVSSAFGNPTTEVESLEQLKSAISRGEVPIIPPIAYDADLAAVAVHSNDAIQALVEALAMEGRKQQSGLCHGEKCSTVDHQLHDIDLTPLRMMVINREGGIPSPARGGNPHLSVNLESEFDYIHDTFIWQKTHPSSLSNLDLIRSCLKRLPRDSSAIIVSHRSPKALIANLITNKPAHSPSLHHSLLPAKQIQHTPTILRHGLPIRVIRKLEEVDKEKLTKLMEASFQKVLNADKYFARLEKDLDFVIVAGEGDRDYQAAAIVTLEKDEEREDSSPITYLDKFAVLPSLQGDGTVDFLWTALRDETFGLGLLDALNPNGGKEGVGLGTDLVWRSRADNPVNKWYFERSNGFVHIPEMGKGGVKGTLFWCDAEDRIRRQLEASPQEDHERKSLSMVMAEEEGRLARWARIIGSIKSCWL